MASAVPKSAPTNTFDSVDDGPKGSTLSKLGAAEPPTEEAVIHCSQLNTIDVAIRMQYLAVAMFPWSTSQNPGTLLWSATVHPDDCNQLVQHLSAMYNTWAGGLDYKFAVCGTGFHAGKIAFVRLPPNIKPETVTAPADFSCFEYVVIDPKTPECISEHVMDQRRFAYHYVDDDKQNKDAIGGYIAAYVLVPLVTSSTGVNNINIEVFSKPAMNFDFGQLRNIIRSGKEVKPDEPEAVVRTFNRSENNGTSIFSNAFTHYTIQPQSQVKPPDTSSFGMYDFAGKASETTPEGFRAQTLRGFSKGKYIATDGKPGTLWVENLKDFPIGITRANFIWYETFGSKTTNRESTTMTAKGTWQVYNQASTTTVDEVTIVYEILTYTPSNEPTLKKNSNESFFCFTIKDDKGTINKHGYQTQQLAVLAKQGELKKIMTPQEALIIDMYDGDLDTPIRRIKLYYNGYCTTKGEDDQITLSAKNYYFKFVQKSRVAEPIPTMPKYEFNQTVSQWRSQQRDA